MVESSPKWIRDWLAPPRRRIRVPRTAEEVRELAARERARRADPATPPPPTPWAELRCCGDPRCFAPFDSRQYAHRFCELACGERERYRARKASPGT